MLHAYAIASPCWAPEATPALRSPSFQLSQPADVRVLVFELNSTSYTKRKFIVGSHSLRISKGLGRSWGNKNSRSNPSERFGVSTRTSTGAILHFE